MSAGPILKRRQESRRHHNIVHRSENAYWAENFEQVSLKLKSDLTRGLSSQEANERLLRNGPNELAAQISTPWYSRLFAQFKSPVVLTLIIATFVSAMLGERTDAIAIVSIVIINALIGFIQEAKAEKSVEALKKLSSPKSRVLREAQIFEVPATQVCVGDILVLEAGDYIPADCRLFIVSQASTDEAILTGESLPITKQIGLIPKETLFADRSNMLYAGTSLATGTARALIVATGMETELGGIAGMLEESEMTQTPLQNRLEKVSSRLLLLCGTVVIIVAILNILQKDPWIDVFMTAISLAVAAIPEGLPAVVTLALALAVRRMTKQNAIIRHLPAVETLGSTDVICTDKTGTLTTGKMKVREVVPQGEEIQDANTKALEKDSNFEKLLFASILCSNASIDENGQGTGDPTEIALLALGKTHHIYLEKISEVTPRLFEWSFESQRKRMSVALHKSDHVLVAVKGAPESILPLCNLNPIATKKINEQLTELSSKGRRLLAVASKRIEVSPKDFDIQLCKDSKDIETELTFLGLVAMADPPRPESIEAIANCRKAGIKVVMITGDHPITAQAIAKELGILVPGKFDGVINGSELEKMSEGDLKSRVESIAVYARVSPEHKLKIVRAWKSLGHIVAMTGDGVNDAPALKEASIGISMGRGGTEVARQASSMILADDNFATIVTAIKEGRAIYGNIRTTIQYLMSGNLAEILVMLGAAIMNWPLPLLPIHLLWINLVTDGLPSLALAAEPVPKDILETSTKPSPTSFIDKLFYKEMIFVGTLMAAMALGIYAYSMKYEDELTARTHVFSFLVFGELFRSFASRSNKWTFFQMGFRTNPYLLAAVVIPVLFQIALHHVPLFQSIFKVHGLNWKECLFMLALTLVPTSIIEIRKWYRNSNAKVLVSQHV